jgi:Flp pilus assembly protein TadG
LITIALGGGRDRHSTVRRSGSKRGQSLVEFALVLPVLLLIVLFAVDFGRLYMGWVTINGMARIGANYAAQHPDAWTTPGDPVARVEYEALMTNSKGALNCALAAWPPTPTYPSGRTVGKPAKVNVDCDFRVAAPLISLITGNPVRVSASSTFPIAYGCLADCPPPPPVGTPPPPVNNCRVVPTMVGLSLGGARNAWVSAGFLDSNFNGPAGSVPTDTVATQTITQPPGADFCISGQAFFSSSAAFTVSPPGPPTSGTCRSLPNVQGMTVAQARAAWVASGFTGTFTPASGSDTSIVIDQTATPATGLPPTPPIEPGDCVEPDTSLSVAYGSPPPPPPAAPCKVPSFVNTDTSAAPTTWTNAGFVAANLTYKKVPPPHYNIGSQTLVGGTWVSCQSIIQVSK